MTEPKFKVGDRVVFIPRGDIVASPIETRPQNCHGTIVKCRDQDGWIAYDVQLDDSILQMMGERVLVAEPIATPVEPEIAEAKVEEPEPQSEAQDVGWQWKNPIKDKEELEIHTKAVLDPENHPEIPQWKNINGYAQALPKKEETT